MAGVSTLFHVQHTDDVTSDEFYAVPSASAPTAGDGAHTSAHHHGSNPSSPVDAAEAEQEPWIEPDEIPGVRKALIAYRVMAYVVGTLLVVLVCVAMPLKYAAGKPTMVNVVGISHGWLYPVLLITAYVLGRKAMAAHEAADHCLGRNRAVPVLCCRILCAQGRRAPY